MDSRSWDENVRTQVQKPDDNYEALQSHRADAEFAEGRPRIAALEDSRQLEEFDTL